MICLGTNFHPFLASTLNDGGCFGQALSSNSCKRIRRLSRLQHNCCSRFQTKKLNSTIVRWCRMKHGTSKVGVELASLLDPVEARNPYFDELSEMVLECDSVEEQVLVFQVLFEGCALDAFRAIANSTENTILGEMASKLVIDDAIHHRSGVTYEEYLLSNANKSLYNHLNDVLKKYTPVYCASLVWRPKVRKWLACRMGEHDRQLVLRNQTMINRAVVELGLKAPYDI